MRLSYHSRTFELLGIDPIESPSARAELDALEHRHGIELPPSVREWYSQESALDLLFRYSNCDHPIPISELGDERLDTHDGGPHDLLDKGLLPFQYENQAVCVWAIRLDGSKDPPVVVDFDSQFTKWLDCSNQFSTHIYCRVWDHSFAMGRDCLVMANIEPVGNTTIEALSAAFEHEPTTHGWPGRTQYRFKREDESILIWASDEQADWFVSADSRLSLEQLLREVWHYDSFATAAYSNADDCQSLLSRLREQEELRNNSRA